MGKDSDAIGVMWHIDGKKSLADEMILAMPVYRRRVGGEPTTVYVSTKDYDQAPECVLRVVVDPKTPPRHCWITDDGGELHFLRGAAGDVDADS